MTKEETRRAAQVMLDSLKEGAVVEYRERDSTAWIKIENRNPVWDFVECDYRIAEPKHTTIKDLPVMCWVRKLDSGLAQCIRGVDEKDQTILFATGWEHIQYLAGRFEYSSDRVNWTPFI